jgi:hypothetical protein
MAARKQGDGSSSKEKALGNFSLRLFVILVVDSPRHYRALITSSESERQFMANAISRSISAYDFDKTPAVPTTIGLLFHYARITESGNQAR